MRIVKIVGLLLVCLLLLVGVLLTAAPWFDGPILHLAGGPFKQLSVDYSGLKPASLKDAGTIEVEVQGISRPSIMVGVLVHDDDVFIPATLKPDEKIWPAAIEKDPRIRIRHNDLVVDAFAHRVSDESLHQTLSDLGAQKYRASYFVPDKTWYFKVSARD